MTHTEFFAALKRGEVARAYLFDGEEEYVKERALEALRAKLLPEGLEALNETALTTPTAAQIIECAEMVPVMAERRLVIARECAYVTSGKAAGDSEGAERLVKYLDALPDSACIVFYVRGQADGRKKLSQAIAKKAAAVRFDPLSDAELNRWIASQFKPLGKAIAPQTAMQLAFTSGRELMTPDEVRMLDNRYALLFIRGEPPIMDEKYNILKHPNVSLTTDGGAAPYEHGGTEHAVATLSLAGIPAEDIPDMEDTEPDYELLSDEEIEALFSI